MVMLFLKMESHIDVMMCIFCSEKLTFEQCYKKIQEKPDLLNFIEHGDEIHLIVDVETMICNTYFVGRNSLSTANKRRTRTNFEEKRIY